MIAHISPTKELDVGQEPSLESTLAYYDPARNRPMLDRAEAALAEQATLEDDTPPALTAGGGVYFSEAVFGAPVRVTANMMMSEPIIQDWSQAVGIRYDPENAWVRRALGLARQIVDRSQGRYAVVPGLLEGPSDICANLRSPTRLASEAHCVGLRVPRPGATPGRDGRGSLAGIRPGAVRYHPRPHAVGLRWWLGDPVEPVDAGTRRGVARGFLHPRLSAAVPRVFPTAGS